MSDTLAARRVDVRAPSPAPATSAPRQRSAQPRTAPRPASRDAVEPRARASAERLVSAATGPGVQLPDPGLTRDVVRRGVAVQQREPAPGSALIVDGVRAFDLVQGAAGTCYFLATLASIAHFRPEWIREMVRDNGDGTYNVRLYGRDGQPRWVTVDDDLASTSAGPLYARGADVRELWPAIIEKAWAQFHGSYERIESSLANFAIRTLTGREASMYLMWLNSQDRLFYLIANAQLENRPMAASTWLGAEERGLTGNHVWSILGAQVDRGERYVILRNPWGHTEFTSSQYDTDVAVNRRRDPNDGVFRMRMDDFRRYFMAIDIMSDVSAAWPSLGQGG